MGQEGEMGQVRWGRKMRCGRSEGQEGEMGQEGEIWQVRWGRKVRWCRKVRWGNKVRFCNEMGQEGERDRKV